MSCTVLLPAQGGRHDRRRRPGRIRRGEGAAARPGAVQEEGNSNVAKAIPAVLSGTLLRSWRGRSQVRRSGAAPAPPFSRGPLLLGLLGRDGGVLPRRGLVADRIHCRNPVIGDGCGRLRSLGINEALRLARPQQLEVPLRKDTALVVAVNPV